MYIDYMEDELEMVEEDVEEYSSSSCDNNKEYE